MYMFYCIYYVEQKARIKNIEEIIHTLRKMDDEFIVKHMLYEHYKCLLNIVYML